VVSEYKRRDSGDEAADKTDTKADLQNRFHSFIRDGIVSAERRSSRGRAVTATLNYKSILRNTQSRLACNDLLGVAH
jgi:hypothetical protein